MELQTLASRQNTSNLTVRLCASLRSLPLHTAPTSCTLRLSALPKGFWNYKSDGGEKKKSFQHFCSHLLFCIINKRPWFFRGVQLIGGLITSSGIRIGKRREKRINGDIHEAQKLIRLYFHEAAFSSKKNKKLWVKYSCAQLSFANQCYKKRKPASGKTVSWKKVEKKNWCI